MAEPNKPTTATKRMAIAATSIAYSVIASASSPAKNRPTRVRRPRSFNESNMCGLGDEDVNIQAAGAQQTPIQPVLRAHPELSAACFCVSIRRAQTVVICEVLASNHVLIWLPKSVTTAMRAMATSATNNPYSVTAIPSSDLTKRRAANRKLFIPCSKVGKETAQTVVICEVLAENHVLI